ncbi:MAG: Asp-tRNA(Asn)/Glu-tRNA(Gln) amidotransferase subunit GatC [Planctomycetes bacterium]|nr:Asp-tRNA(Asn)/Glu-tRNA(Gln) amidotransferase subunit GatC [Planctomycetota bacterium]
MDVREAQKIAGLSRLSLTEAELTRMAGQLTAILGYFQKLSEVPTDGVAPASHPADMRSPLRPDVAAPFVTKDPLVQLSRGAEGELYRVPRVLE